MRAAWTRNFADSGDSSQLDTSLLLTTGSMEGPYKKTRPMRLGMFRRFFSWPRAVVFALAALLLSSLAFAWRSFG